MIKPTNAIENFKRNMERTEMLITATNKIAGYNRIYQFNAYNQSNEYGEIVTKVQKEELIKIERSCSEHSIISLCIALETYYKELLQELLYKNPSFFISKDTKYYKKLKKLIEDSKGYDYNKIEKGLKIKYRPDYFDFFDLYSIPFLVNEEIEFIKYIFLRRNCLVHNAGKIDERTKKKLSKITYKYKGSYLPTEAKRLRTQLKRIILKADKRIRLWEEKIPKKL